MTELTAVRIYDDKDVGRVLPVRLCNERLEGKEVDVRVVERDGSVGPWLLSVGPNGVRRAQRVNPDLGFPLDNEGRIVLNE